MSGRSTNPHEPTERESSGIGKLLGWFAAIFVVFAVIGAAMFLQRRGHSRVLAQQTERLALVRVAVIKPAMADNASELVLPGNIKPFMESAIYARTNGYLKSWTKDIGSSVKKGDLLAEIETPEIDAQLAQARADLSTAQANRKLAGLTAERYQDLLKTDSVSKQEVDNFTSNLTARQAMVQSAEANVKRLEDLESFKHVYAPFSGVITQRNVDNGMLINAGAGSGAGTGSGGGPGGGNGQLFYLAETNPLRVFVSVPQSFAQSIHVGLEGCLELTEIPGRQFCGKVARTANAIDPATRTLLTEVDVPNAAGRLLQGSYAQVHFKAKDGGKSMVLPINALLFRPEGAMAAVVGPDNRLTLKKLAIGRDYGNRLEILQGINADDSVVVNPPDSLDNNQQVVVMESPAKTPASQPSKRN